MTSTKVSATSFPLPGSGKAEVIVPAPGPGPQQWAGAPSAVLDRDGSVLLVYRVRAGQDSSIGRDYNVIARSPDGVRFTPLVIRRPGQFGAAMIERAALVPMPDGRWRLYVSCATPGSKAWWVGMLEAADLRRLADAPVRPVFPADERTAYKDPIVRRDDTGWHAWICCHPLDVPGAEDRMSTGYATSDDGLHWHWHGTILSGRPGEWDARGARLTAVLPDGRAAYDGRATAEENWFERTALAAPGPAGLRAIPDSPIVDVRYLDVLALPDGNWRIYYEARLPDESHELRTELVPA
jgi:hypothetical protein